MTTPTDPGSGDTTPVSPDPYRFGVTVADVNSVLPAARLDDDLPEGTRGSGINGTAVNLWIELVAAEVFSRIAGYERITNEHKVRFIGRVGRNLVMNGAAYYWEAARTQHRRDHAGGSYAEDLESRYKASLDGFAKQVGDWLDDGGPGITASMMPGPSGMFPPPFFTDGYRW